MSAEQWKEMGLCPLCRRKDYCKKECRARRDRLANAVRRFVEKASGIDGLRENIEALKKHLEVKNDGNQNAGGGGDRPGDPGDAQPV